jgi:hypothetical protein
MLTAVRQAPLTAMLSPMRVPSRRKSDSTTIRRPRPDGDNVFMVPNPSIMPVNMVSLRVVARLSDLARQRIEKDH